MQELSHSRFLALLKQRNIEVAVRSGRLQISGPPSALDPEVRAELARRKPELLQMLQQADTASGLAPLIAMNCDCKIPQTQAQQGMWLIDHFAPGNVAYNIPEAFIVEGPVEVPTLQKAIDNLLARHKILQTYFYEEDGELFQAISAAAAAPLGFTDLTGLAESERDRALHNSIREQARRPFDLAHAPLVRFHLFRLTPQRNAIFFNIHHIIADGRSLEILRQELTVLYVAALRNETALLPELPVQYRDYAIWAHRRLADGAMAGQIQYWKTKLAGAPPYLELPSNRPYPEKRTAWGANVLISIPRSVCAGLHEIAREEGATMFMTLLAAFTVLIYRYSGKEDFCVGSPFTHRNQVETGHLIGLFVNLLVFRCRMEGEPSFREILRRTRITALEAYEHSEVPFQELVRALKPDLRLLRSPLFGILFGFDSDMGSGRNGLIQIDTNPGTAKFDLTLQLSENPDGISGWFEYCTDLFDAAAIEQLAAQFLALLQEIVNEPEKPVSMIDLLPGASAAPVALEPAVPRSRFWNDRIRALSQRLSHSSARIDT